MLVSLQSIKRMMSLMRVCICILKQMVSIKSVMGEVFGSHSAGFVGSKHQLDRGKLNIGAPT